MEEYLIVLLPSIACVGLNKGVFILGAIFIQSGGGLVGSLLQGC
jgi:hypothetical protein